MKSLKVRAVCAALGLALAGSVLTAVPAQAVSERNFMLITTRGAPTWRATANLYSENGTKLYTWRHQEYQIGGKALWYFTWNGDRGYIDITILANGGSVLQRRIPLNRDSCFVVGVWGESKYTGDDTTGCNPN